MSATPTELELSIQPSSQQDLQRGPQSETHHQTLQPEAQLSESNTEQQQQQQAKLLCIRLQKLLLLFGGFSLCVALLGLIYYKFPNQSRSSNQTGAEAPCLSSACQLASARLSMSVDPFQEPCDYFLFACESDRLSPGREGSQRGHPQNHSGNSERSGQSKERKNRGKLPDRKTALLQYLRDILESNYTSRSSAVQKAKQFYASCLDTGAIASAGVEPFISLINNQLGGWAALGQWNQTDFNYTLSLLMRDYATFPFFNLYVGKDPKEAARGTTKRYIQIDQPDLLIPFEWNSKAQKSQARTQTLRPFLETCKRYLALLGAPPSTSMLHVAMFVSLSSELAVAAAPLQHRMSKGQLYQRMTIRELQVQAPAIDWLFCLQAAFHPLALLEDDLVFVHNLPYIVQMSPIIEKWLNKHELNSSGPLQTFMVLNLLYTLMQALDSRFSETANNLSAALGNTDRVAPRWRYCVLETEKGFDSVLTHLLSQRMAHQEADEMIQNIFSSFKSKLHELKWTDEKSLHSVMEKVQSLKPRLWTTNEISGEAELDLLFSKVSLSSHSFFSNYVQLLSLWQKRRRKVLTEQNEAADIFSAAPLVTGNELVFPLGMFVPPLFHPTYPRAMNYGATGFLLAKDILHLLLPDIYSQSETVHAVGECVWARYLTVAERRRRGGAFPLSAAQKQEVWVQYSALQIALQAYYLSLKSHPGDTSVSGLSLTHLFLRSFSQVNCDFDPYDEVMPLESSFLITVICAKSHLCPSSLQCPSKTTQHSLLTC
ncbi:kell blood group glycoprotein isoform X2 [Echeneis naucrates]|uniref:kell blood group glycoprotein isoform X2 n=1 Tax=Echeneis naucrates TaxID=173247 RepID=UPI001113E595|nr:kell blood group glycoprotein-like isoform X2 [Echeneis naucrates]